MFKKTSITPELLRKLLRYEPETGELFWRERTVDMFPTQGSQRIWNTRYSGKPACSGIDINGYKRVCVLYERFFSHRVIWAMQTGAWPEIGLDHIDRDRLNNRIENLRLATQKENLANVTAHKDSTSKYVGVSWHKRDKAWRAVIGDGYKTTHLGYFASEIEAARAYDAAKRHLGEFANLNFPDQQKDVA